MSAMKYTLHPKFYFAALCVSVSNTRAAFFDTVEIKQGKVIL
jgi:hypothetical protein